MSENPIMALPRHVRAVTLCQRGRREWLTRHGFSNEEFSSVGISVERLEATGDAFGIMVAAQARKEASDGKKQ